MGHIAVERRSMSLGKWSKQVFNQVADAVVSECYPIHDWEIRSAEYHPDGYDWLDDYHPITEGELWGGPDITCLLRSTFTIPKELDGKKIYFSMFTSTEVLISENGKYIDGLDPNRSWCPFLEHAKAGEKHTILLEAYTRSKPDDDRGVARKLKGCLQHFKHPSLIVIDEELLALKYDLDMLYQSAYAPAMEPGAQSYYLKKLEEILSLFPMFESEDVPALKKAAPKIREFIQNNIYCAGQQFGKAGKLACVAHSHLDIAYHWKVEQTVQKNARTVLIQLRMMERYPEFKYSHSQAWTYEQLEKYYPDLFKEVKKRIAQGRWEIVGAMYVEPDCNLISAESMVRQLLYGKQYFQEKFNVSVDNAWLPDVFGNSAIMPQILKQAGVDYFVSNKMSTWNDTNRFPYNTFIWRGLDGSKVCASVPPVHFITWMDPNQAIENWKSFQDKAYCDESLQMYGYGDGGSGVTDEMMEYFRRQQNMPGIPEMRITTGKEYLHSVFSDPKKFPVWDGDLYLEMHRGTFTSTGLLKCYNRKGEFLAQETETLCAFSSLDSNQVIPPSQLRKPWKKLLLNQFHDILPGSHTHPVTEDAIHTYEKMKNEFHTLQENAFSVLTKSDENTGVVINPLLQERNLVYFKRKPEVKSLCDSMGNLLPVQRISCADGDELFCVQAKLPGMSLVGFTASKESCNAQSDMQVSVKHMENRFYAVDFSADGSIAGVFDKIRGLKVNAQGAVLNEWQLFEDCPGMYNAWDIVKTYKNRRIDLPGWKNISVAENGPLTIALRMERSFENSGAVQIIRMYRDNPRIDFETFVDWHETERLLKVAFPVNVKAATYTTDTSAGVMERMNNQNTSWEQARFEVPCHKWVDLSEGLFGVSILNDCKYGCDVQDNVIRMSLLRAPIRPDRESDKGTHRFTYSLCSHGPSWQESGIVEQAYDLNVPCKLVWGKKLNEEKTYLFVDNPAVKIFAFKTAEDNSGDIIVRFGEVYGSHGTVTISAGFSVTEAYRCNLLEQVEKPVILKDNAMRVDFRPNEIFTIRLKRDAD
jgi:alpha-mannosidase